ncbi:hypothetical protein TMES_21035 [Thalassospira mesophila]|uniref:Uncharacterized protein n=2 Tax=Thalassospira mesophila TaxID=1293891 RepID=A0A1Y2KV09_9PROT|nr:hypothetical protein TMES_21035 [Thalassospira mesophila]
MKQRMAVSVWLLSNSIVLGLLIIASPAQAACNTCAKQGDFFDYGYAERMWNELQTRDQFWTEWNRVFPVAKAAFDAGLLTGTVSQMRDTIKDRDDATEIMQGYDLWIAQSKVWKKVAFDQASAGSIAGINMAGEHRQMCVFARMHDIFNHQCNGLPDWRTDEQAEADTAKYARWQKKLADQ